MNLFERFLIWIPQYNSLATENWEKNSSGRGGASISV